jgi:hypothetical protein
MVDPNLIITGIVGAGIGVGGRIIFDWLKNRNGKVDLSDVVKKSELYKNNGSQIYLTEKSHEQLCLIAHLENQKHFTKEIESLKDNYLEPKFSKIEQAIERIKDK